MFGTVNDVSATLVASTIRRRSAGGEDPLLFRHRQARVQRQDVVSIAQFAAQQLRRFVDLPFAREEHQHIACAMHRAAFDLANRLQDLLILIDVAAISDGR